MTFRFSVPTPSGAMDFQVEPGTSLLFVGANGGGKTRLAVKIENDLGDKAHRISAHRALILNPSVPKISERVALLGLRTGHAHETAALHNRIGSRWSSNAASSLLNDYDFLVQALFAEQPVGWVERSDTHQLMFAKMMGFAKGSTHRTGRRTQRCGQIV
jgi:hypothetical protein